MCVCVCVRVCVCVGVCVITDGAVLKLISFTGNNKTLVSFYNGDLGKVMARKPSYSAVCAL